MNHRFSIDFNWMSREYGNNIERATLAEVVITADGNVATELEDLHAKTVRYAARVSAYELAVWFASNWWRLLWEPEANTISWKMSHRIGAAGGGYLWPDLTFSSDGTVMSIQSQATLPVKGQPVRYLNSFNVLITLSDFEKTVDTFIDGVIARLASEVAQETELAMVWKEIQNERNDPVLTHRRKLEAIMSFDPEEAPGDLIQYLEGAEAKYGSSAIEEIAAYSRKDAPDLISTLWNDVRLRSTLIRIPHTENLRKLICDAMSLSKVPWKQATAAAKAARDNWALGGGPVTTEHLCGLLSISKDIILQRDGTRAPISAGFRNGNVNNMSIFLKSPHSANRRFALVRLIGDHLVTNEVEKLLPATTSETWRQKFQRAFAQEFLCPYAELEKYLEGEQLTDETLDDAATYFDVSPLLIRTTLVNKGQLDRMSLMCEPQISSL